jgi:hypothetical protein
MQRIAPFPNDFATPTKIGFTLVTGHMTTSLIPFNPLSAARLGTFLCCSRFLSLICGFFSLSCPPFSFGLLSNRLLCCGRENSLSKLLLLHFLTGVLCVDVAEVLASAGCRLGADETVPLLAREAFPFWITLWCLHQFLVFIW